MVSSAAGPSPSAATPGTALWSQRPGCPSGYALRGGSSATRGATTRSQDWPCHRNSNPVTPFRVPVDAHHREVFVAWKLLFATIESLRARVGDRVYQLVSGSTAMTATSALGGSRVAAGRKFCAQCPASSLKRSDFDVSEPLSTSTTAWAANRLPGASYGAAMLAADFSVDYVRKVLAGASDRYHLEPRLLILPNYIGVGESCNSRIEHVGTALRYDQAFSSAGWCAEPIETPSVRRTGLPNSHPDTGSTSPTSLVVNMIGYAVPECGMRILILQPTPTPGWCARRSFRAARQGAPTSSPASTPRFSGSCRSSARSSVTFAAFTIGRWLPHGPGQPARAHPAVDLVSAGRGNHVGDTWGHPPAKSSRPQLV